MQKNNNNIPAIIFLGVLSLFTLFVFVYGTIIPFAQMSDFSSLVKAGKTDLLLKKESKDFSPIIQRDIARSYLNFYLNSVKENSSDNLQILTGFLDKTIEIYEGLIKKTPYYAYDYAVLGQALSLKAQLPGEEKYHEKAELAYKKAIEIMPNRQEILYAHSLNLALQEKYQEFFDVFEKAHTLSNGVGVSNDSIMGALQRLTVYFYEKRDKERYIKVATWLSEIDLEQKDLYLQAIDYIQKTGQFPILEFNIE